MSVGLQDLLPRAIDVGKVNTQSGSALTDLESALRTATALVTTLPDKVIGFVSTALGETVDPRLRHLLPPALALLSAMDVRGMWFVGLRSFEARLVMSFLRTPSQSPGVCAASRPARDVVFAHPIPIARRIFGGSQRPGARLFVTGLAATNC